MRPRMDAIGRPQRALLSRQAPRAVCISSGCPRLMAVLPLKSHLSLGQKARELAHRFSLRFRRLHMRRTLGGEAAAYMVTAYWAEGLAGLRQARSEYLRGGPILVPMISSSR